MKKSKDTPGPLAMQRYWELYGRFILMVFAAIILWKVQDFAASFAASEVTTSTTLRTVEEKNDERVILAYQRARQSLRLTTAVEFTTEPVVDSRTRDAWLTFSGKSKGEVLDARESLVAAMQAEFAKEGPGEIFDLGHAPHATPVPNAAMEVVRQVFRWGAVAAGLASLVFLWVQWRRARLPIGALLGIMATTMVLLTYLMERQGVILWMWVLGLGLPIGLLVLMTHVTLRVRQAAAWPEATARISKSVMVAEKHRFQGGTTQVRNKPEVTYHFNVGDRKVYGTRISIGIAPADNADKVLDRYPVGAEVPVYYDPADPRDCVLERQPPFSLGCLWLGTLLFIMGYATAVTSFFYSQSVVQYVREALPQMPYPVLFVVTAVLGVLMLISSILNFLNPQKSRPWRQTRGRIVSSKVESFRNSSGSGNRTHTYYQAVVEFRYEVAGRDYHNTLGSDNSLTVSVAGSQSFAEKQAARYYPGMAVNVYYDEENPSASALKPRSSLAFRAGALLIVSLVFFAVAWWAARP